jgi:hypothetical protein
MNRVFPFPLYNFIKIIYANGGFSGRGLLNAGPWFVKTTLFEPLRLIELAIHNKKIEQHVIQHPPVFILGHYRSGTTYLQRIFMQDKRYGYMSLFQSVLPELMLGFEKYLTPVFEITSRLLSVQNSFHRMPFTFDFPGEEDVAMVAFLNPCAAQWGELFPEKLSAYFEKYVLFKNIAEHTKQQWVNDYLYLLKKISLQNHSRPLVLKSPPNTARIELLVKLFPGARFIHICRNPYDTYASTKRLLVLLHRNYILGKTTHADLDKLIVEIYAKMMNCYIQQRPLIPAGQLIEIKYESFMQQPLEHMNWIYRKLDLGDFCSCEKDIASFVAKQNGFPVLKYTLAETEKNFIDQQCGEIIEYWHKLEALE